MVTWPEKSSRKNPRILNYSTLFLDNIFPRHIYQLKKHTIITHYQLTKQQRYIYLADGISRPLSEKKRKETGGEDNSPGQAGFK